MVARLTGLVVVGALVQVCGCDGAFDLVAVVVPDAGDITADADVDAGEPLACATGLVFEDRFSTGVLDTTAWIRETNVTEHVRVVNGQLEVAVGSGQVNAGVYSGLRRTTVHDLTGRRLAAKILEVPSPTSSLQAVLFARTTSNTDSTFVMAEAGKLLCAGMVNSAYEEYCTGDYDSTQHRFWALQIAGSMVRWEVSPDGIRWNTLMTRSIPSMPYDPTQLELGVYVYQLFADNSPGKMVVDDLQLCALAQ